MQELKHLRDNHKDLWNKLIELSKNDTANPYFNAFKKTTVQGLEEQFTWEDRQMNIFDYIKESEVV